MTNSVIAQATSIAAVILPAFIGAAAALTVFFLRETSERNRKRTELLQSKLEDFLFSLADIQRNLVTDDVVPPNIWNTQSNKLATSLYRTESLTILHFPALDKEMNELIEKVHIHRAMMSKIGKDLAPYFTRSDEAWRIFNEHAREELQESTTRIGDLIREIRKKIRKEKYDLTLEDGIYH